ncbi:MAG: hypothetical protein VB080_10605 [Propionicimonas sp.]|uniref:hypothetical protein n=1 Tax=Propionicimonas sp. TaxID=1955623 RepID=UPI002B1FF17C|nr:hypothetical protein [Propionicimonas sp.]MEA4944869.1 hypothetical protein [Propionicimonas sp.]MEA5055637.1 hypothetical protein [Propionicimonas sp.]
MTIANGPGDSRELCIRADGDLAAAVNPDLGELVVTRTPSGVELRGPLLDATQQWGLLHRLQHAGLVLRSVERVEPGEAGRTQAEQPAQLPTGPCVTVEVQGYVAALIAATLQGAHVHQHPPSTTLVRPLTTDQTLFDTLWELEALALDVLDLHIDG